MGLSHLVLATHVDEDAPPDQPTREVVRALAEAKAAAGARVALAGAFVLAADTSIDVDGRRIGKPADPADARRILLALSGRSHDVFTGVAAADPAGRVSSRVERTRVQFSTLTTAHIDAYVSAGEAMGKAGAYGIQGPASAWVRRLDGDYYNVVGLPVAATLGLLRAAGYALPPHLRVS